MRAISACLYLKSRSRIFQDRDETLHKIAKNEIESLFFIIYLKLPHLLVTLSSGQNKFGENSFYSNPWVLKSFRMFNTFKTFLSSLLLMRLVIYNFFYWFWKVFPSEIYFFSIPVLSGTFSQIYTNTASMQDRILNIS